MGFEPFTMPRRTAEKPPEGSREAKVEALAKLLHSRGLTSSMTDARRLAEGMVDVEKKVVREGSKALKEGPAQPAANTAKADIADTAPHAAAKQTFNLSLPESFAHFVAQAAALSHQETRPRVEITTPHKDAMRYGRDELKPIAEVPHIHARKQVFFEDAPPLSQARGFGGAAQKQPQHANAQQTADFSAQREDTLRRMANASSTQVDATLSGVKVTKTEVSPKVEIVEERMIVEDVAPPVAEQAVPKQEAPAQPAAPVEAKPVPEPEEQLVEKTQELPVTRSSEPREDLAKKHGVDLFQMFKKK